jgi:hypothetical protein
VRARAFQHRVEIRPERFVPEVGANVDELHVRKCVPFARKGSRGIADYAGCRPAPTAAIHCEFITPLPCSPAPPLGMHR